jgi:sugar phosphate isomerase/epimerase
MSKMSRRDFVKTAAVGSAAVPAFVQGQGQTPAGPAGQAPAEGRGAGGGRRGGGGGPVRTSEKLNPLPIRIGMTDWNLGMRGDVGKVQLAREIGLDGIQVSVVYPTNPEAPTLRDRATQIAYKKAALANGVQIVSLAIGGMGGTPPRGPLHSNPAAAILLAESIEIAHNIGAQNILNPVLRSLDPTNKAQVDVFVSMMKELGRYGEKMGVVMGLEITISAEHANMLMDQIGSDYVNVYYDPHNVVGQPTVKDIYAEPKMYGAKRIGQVHVKLANNMLLGAEGGRIDWPRMANELYNVGYTGWYVLETGAPSMDLVADTRKNIEYVRKTFRMPQPKPVAVTG